MIQVIIPESMVLFYQVGSVGFFISFVLSLLFYFRKDISNVATTYMAGAAATFFFGGFAFLPSGFFIEPYTAYYTATWTSPFGLIGGYALIVIAFAQLWFDRKNSGTSNKGSNSEV